MLEPFGEVSGDVSEYFSSGYDFRKMTRYKVIAKKRSKTFTAEIQLEWELINGPRRRKNLTSLHAKNKKAECASAQSDQRLYNSLTGKH